MSKKKKKRRREAAGGEAPRTQPEPQYGPDPLPVRAFDDDDCPEDEDFESDDEINANDDLDDDGGLDLDPEMRRQLDDENRAAIRHKPEEMRLGRPWYAYETVHYVLMFDDTARRMMNPLRFSRDAEFRLRRIAKLIGLKRPKRGHVRRIRALGPPIPYFVHDPARCRWGGFDERGIDLGAGLRKSIYRCEEAKAIAARAFGPMTPFFLQGFGMFARNPDSRGNDLKTAEAIAMGAVPPLFYLVAKLSLWAKWEDGHWYLLELAGSFVKHLYFKHGQEKLVRFFSTFKPNIRKIELRAAFEEVYGCNLFEMEHEWRARLAEECG